MDARSFTVGPVQENCYLVRRDGADRAVIVDPGGEPARLLGVIERLGVELDAILLTHTHFDHIGAVAPVARETGAEVWVPEIERGVLADIMSYVPFPGFGPFESYEAEHTLAGGERLELAGFEIDVLSEDGRRRLALRNICFWLLDHRAGFEYVETPAFEDTDLFARGVGEATDIVQKEMFTFEDKGGRSLTLRPEGTAGVCRAYVQHGMHKLPQPVKLHYSGPFFRHEAPQAGRFRQFAQLGAEALGSDDPTLDAEAILLLGELLERA